METEPLGSEAEEEEVKMPPRPRIRPPLDRECVPDTVVTDVVVAVAVAVDAAVDADVNTVPVADADADTGTDTPSPCRW